MTHRWYSYHKTPDKQDLDRKFDGRSFYQQDSRGVLVRKCPSRYRSRYRNKIRSLAQDKPDWAHILD